MEEKKELNDVVEETKKTEEGIPESEVKAEESQADVKAADENQQAVPEEAEKEESPLAKDEEKPEEDSAKEESLPAEDEKEDVSEIAENTKEGIEEAEPIESTEKEDTEAAEEEPAEDTEAAKEDSEEENAGDIPQKKIKKKKLDKTNIIVIVVCAVIVLAVLAFVAIKLEWFKPAVKAEIKLDDYSKIEVVEDTVKVTDDMAEQYIQSILESQAESVKETKGTVANGDNINIDYAGRIAATGEAFDGGTASGQDLTIGSGTFIPGFEEALIGKEIGSTSTIQVTFPEDYHAEKLAGIDAEFDVTINYKTVSVAPELTDEWVKENSGYYVDGEVKNVKEFKEAIKDYMYNRYLHSAMLEAIQSMDEVISYDENQEAEMKQYCLDTISRQASMYGYDADSLASMYGFASADEYATEESHYYLDMIMVIDKIFKQEGLSITDEEVDEELVKYLLQNGVSDKYTVDEFKETQGEVWFNLFKVLEVKFEKAMEAIEDNVVFIEAPQEETSEQVTEPESESDAEPESETK